MGYFAAGPVIALIVIVVIFVSNRFNIHRTRKGFPNSGIDTFTNMADKGLLIIDRVVTSQLNGSIDSEKGQWVIPN